MLHVEIWCYVTEVIGTGGMQQSYKTTLSGVTQSKQDSGLPNRGIIQHVRSAPEAQDAKATM